MIAFGLGEKLHMLNQVYAAEEYMRFSDMADHMGVSKQALAIRMKGLGLGECEFLQDPHALVNVCPDDISICIVAHSQFVCKLIP